MLSVPLALLGMWAALAVVLIAASPARTTRPDKGDAQTCVVNAWLRAHEPDSEYLPENGWNDGNGYRCPDQPEARK